MLGRATDPADPGTRQALLLLMKMIALESGGHTSMYVKNVRLILVMLGTGLMAQWVMAVQPQRFETSVTYATATVAICAADAIPKITLSITPSGSGGSYCTTKRRPFQPHQREVLYQYFQVLLHCLEITLLFWVRVR